jgi:hypothetical protein
VLLDLVPAGHARVLAHRSRQVGVPQQQVVALGEHHTRGRRHGQGAADRLLEVPVEARREDDGFVGRPQPAQQGDVPGDVEGVRRALAVGAPEPLQLPLVEVEPVHRDQRGRRAEDPHPGDQRQGDRGLARAGRTGEAHDDASPVPEHPLDLGGEGEDGRVVLVGNGHR